MTERHTSTLDFVRCAGGLVTSADGCDGQQRDGNDLPWLDFLPYICQYPTSTEFVSHFFTSKIST